MKSAIIVGVAVCLSLLIPQSPMWPHVVIGAVIGLSGCWIIDDE